MMTFSLILPNIFSLVRKSVEFKQNSLVFMSIPTSIMYENFIALLLKGVPKRELILPIVCFGTLLVLFFFVTARDFYTGLRASRQEHIEKTGRTKGYISSTKLWASIWKFTGVVLIGTILTVFSLVFLVLSLNALYHIFLTGIAFFFLIVISFDLHSIGENHERRYGKKPPFYGFVDKVSTAFQERIINKISGNPKK